MKFNSEYPNEIETIHIASNLGFGRKFSRVYIEVILKTPLLEYKDRKWVYRIEENDTTKHIIHSATRYIPVSNEKEMYQVPILYSAIHNLFIDTKRIPIEIYFEDELSEFDCEQMIREVEEKELAELRNKLNQEMAGLKNVIDYTIHQIDELYKKCDDANAKRVIGKIRANSIIDEKTINSYPGIVESYKALEKLKVNLSEMNKLGAIAT